MQTWSDGYMTDVEYTHGYYMELNPLRTRLALLNAGYAYPDVHTACELGFGQGLSINVHGAASSTEWFGTDFNPTQANFAKQMADDPVRAARLFDDAFDVFCNRTDLPDFDFIGLHGIWSWISDSNRAVIAEFIRRKLKVGGVLYISYNTQPGWAAMAPMRDLLHGYSDALAAPGIDTSTRIDAALDFANKLLDSGAQYGKANPSVQPMLKHLGSQSRNYLAHEYFNRDWMPMSFARMTEWMESLKLSFAGSANYTDQIDVLNLTADQQRLLGEIPDWRFRETAKDFVVNQRFRRDYWIRGACHLKPFEQAERVRAQCVILVQPGAKVAMKTKGAVGEVGLKEEIYRPVLDALADHKPHTIGAIERAVARNGLGLPHVCQVLMILAGKGDVHPVQGEEAIVQARPATNALNKRLCLRARYSTDINFLASPVTGGGILVTRFEQLFLLARRDGLAAPQEWAKFVSDVLDAQNQRILLDGKPVDSNAAQLKELGRQAIMFADERLPILAALGIA